MQTQRTFAAYAKIKSDVTKHPIPSVNKEELIYFVHNFKKNARHDTVYNIDLKRAYAYILFKDSLISRTTYAYLSKLKKQERLASVGMLAAKKNTFIFENGEPIDMQPNESSLAPFFYYAVQQTAVIMEDLKRICRSNYLFTWVDGIYFRPNERAYTQCCDYLDSINFPYTGEVLRNFNVRITQSHVKLSFDKAGHPKIFNLPHPLSDFKRIVIDAIINVNNKKNETSTSQVSA
jgi:hypothetical protein